MKNYNLTVVMPVYNEADAIEPVLEKWVAILDTLGIRYRIYAYNDGSKDATGDILERIANSSNGRIVGITKPNSGHGPTILQGYREAVADSEWIFQIDSDDEMGPESFPTLWAQREKYDFLVGQRDGRKQPLSRKIISFVSRLCVRIFYGKGVWDVNAPYRLMRASTFERFYHDIPADTFAPNVILSGLAARHKLRMLEIPVPQHDRTTGEVSIKKWKLLKAAAKSFTQTIAYAGVSPKLCIWLSLSIIIICLAVNCITLTRSPTVWIDEVSYTDPGVRLASGQGFTSSVWYSQNEVPFFAGNVPLYPTFIAGWVSLFGDSIFAVRSANLFLITITALLAFYLTRKLSNTLLGLFAMLVVYCFPGPLFTYRSARPDVLVFILGELFLLSLFTKRPVARYAGIALSAFLMPFAGLQGIPWLCLLFVFGFFLTKDLTPLSSWLKNAIPASIGGILGLSALLSLYCYHGMLKTFYEATLGRHSCVEDSSIFTTLAEIANKPPISTTFCVLSIITLLLLWGQKRKVRYFGAIIVCIATPFIIEGLGPYPTYYNFMADIPMFLLLCVGVMGLIPSKRWIIYPAIIGCLGLCAIGLPARTAVGILGWDARDHKPVEDFIAKHIPENAIVRITWQTYYAVRNRTPHVYIVAGSDPSIYTEQTEYWIIDAANVESFQETHPLLQPIATYQASGTSAGTAVDYAFTIFTKKILF